MALICLYLWVLGGKINRRGKMNRARIVLTADSMLSGKAENSFLSLWQNTWERQLIREKTYFGSSFEGFS
jgi:hypothetical protein